MGAGGTRGANIKFRPLLEKHHPGRKLFQEVHHLREARGVKVSKGTMVDATLIHAPSSTKNRDKGRDPDRHQMHIPKQDDQGFRSNVTTDSDSS